MMSIYVKDHNQDDALVALADLKSLPPVPVQAGGDEILPDDSVRFAVGVKASGVVVSMEVWPHT